MVRCDERQLLTSLTFRSAVTVEASISLMYPHDEGTTDTRTPWPTIHWALLLGRSGAEPLE